MDIAHVVGQVVSTVKELGLANHTLLVLRRCEAASPDDESGETFVAIDLVGAGRGELVLVVTGSAARIAASTERCPTDAAVVGVVDSVVHDGVLTFSKS